MPSNVNPLVPSEGTATTASVRANFQHIKTELENLENADAYEINERIAAVGGEAAARAIAIAAETSARNAALADVAIDIAAAVATEASNRINADADEANARTGGDAAGTAYADAIMATEESARIAGDSGVYASAITLVNDEASTRTSADNALDARLDTLEAVDGWHVIGATGEPGWTSNFSDYGSGWPTPAFKKLANGMVIFRGLVACSSFSPYTGPWVMPAGYRVSGNTMFNCASATTPCRVCPIPGGSFSIFEYGAPFLNMGDVSYYAEA